MSDKDFTSSSYEKFLAEKRLMGSRCSSCGSLRLPPRPLCPDCHGEELEWVEMSGNAKLAAFTAVSVGTTPTIEEGHSRDNPYLVGVVQLEEGPKVSARILGLDAKNPDKVKVGTPLKVEYLEQKEGKKPYLAFKAV